MSLSITPADTFTLPTGTERPLYQVEFNGVRFLWNGYDVTDFLSRSQKRTFPGYDPTNDLNLASDQGRIDRGLEPVVVGDTSTAGLFLGGVAADVNGLATGIRDFAGIGPENAGKRSPLFWLVVIGGLGFVLYQVGVFAWIRKKLSA